MDGPGQGEMREKEEVRRSVLKKRSQESRKNAEHLEPKSLFPGILASAFFSFPSRLKELGNEDTLTQTAILFPKLLLIPSVA